MGLRRQWTLRAVAAGATILLAFGAPTAFADGPPDPAAGPAARHLQVGAGTSASVSPSTLIDCELEASKPLYSAGKMTGTGGISSCTPHAPAACTFSVEIIWYNQGPGTWQTVAETTDSHLCPPPYRSKTAPYTCDYRSSDPLYSYKTRTVATIVDSNGDADPGHYDSPQTLEVRCL